MTYCCPTMKEAVRDGTDSEGYGPAVSEPRSDYPGYQQWSIGSVETAISYCPWCGEKLEHKLNPPPAPAGL